MYLSRKEEFVKMNDYLNKITIELDKIKLDLNSDKSTYSELVNFIESEVNRNRDSISELKDPFLLFIVGSGNYGKSTLINCLLQDKFIETTDLPNTWKLDLFLKSKKEKIEIIYQENFKVKKSLREGINLIKGEEKKYKDSKKKISKLINEYKNTKEFDISKIQNYKIELEKKHLYKSNIREIKYYINKEGLLNDFTIVDTPGLNQTLSKNTYERMIKYYERADGIIWMIDAQNLISRKSYNLIEEINEIEKAHKSKKDIIGVVNKIDIIKMGKKENLEKIKLKAKELYKNKFNDLVFISAKQGIEGIINKNDSLYSESNINELLEAINNNFFLKAKEKQIQSKYKNLYIMRDSILDNIINYKRQVYNDMSEYNESKFKQKELIRAFRLFTKEHLKNINKNYNINEIKEFQDICNLQLNKIYKDISYKSNLNQSTSIENLNLKLIFTKSKYLVQSKYMDDKYYTKKYLSQNIFNLTKEIDETIEDNIELIEKASENIRDDSFRIKNIDYEKVREHIAYLNNIENILKNLG